MSDLRDLRAIIVGAGVFGVAIGLALGRDGANVVLIDEGGTDGNASAIAAGMLAPAFEAGLDPASHGRFDLLSSARDLWPAFVEALGQTGLERCGALMRGPGEALERVRTSLVAAGARVETSPDSLFTPDDWRIEPRFALAAMREAILRGGGRTLDGRVVGADKHSATFADGSTFQADAVILACGYGSLNLAAELTHLIPVKGQILRFKGANLTGGPILRGEASYVVPGVQGAAAGASMLEGVSDRTIDPEVTQWLQRQAAHLAPELASAPAVALAGIRPATPDGIPMIGRIGCGVWLATGARRNGWLLAPLAARMVTEGLAGARDDPRFSPTRFRNTSPAGKLDEASS